MNNWHTTTLGEVCLLVTDGKHGDCANEDRSGFYFISAKDIRDGRINYDRARQIKESDFAETHRRTDLKPGDVLVTNSGTIGRLAVASDDERTFRTTFQKSVAILKPRPREISSQFLYYFLTANLNAFVRPVAGAAQKNLLLGDIRQFHICKPRLIEQERIASILCAYDDLIENNRRRMVLLEEAARILFREWFARFRFPGHEHVKIIDGLPEGWTSLTLGDITKTNAESYRAKELPDKINYIDISSVERGRILSRTNMLSSDAPGRARRKARKGDVTWSNVRPNLKAYALVMNPMENEVFSTGFTVLSATKVPFTWLYQCVTMDSFVGYLVNHATGAGYPAVRPDDFERAAVNVPTRALLESYHEAVSANFELCATLDDQNAKLAQARDLLLPRLMNGEIAV